MDERTSESRDGWGIWMNAPSDWLTHQLSSGRLSQAYHLWYCEVHQRHTTMHLERVRTYHLDTWSWQMIIWHDNLKEMPSLMPSPFIHLVIISLPVLQIYGQKTNPFTLPINLASLRYHAKKWLSEHSPYLHEIGNKIRIKPPNQAFPCAPIGLPSNPVNSPIEWCLNLDRFVD